MTWKDINFETYRNLMYFYQNLDQYGDDLDKTIGLLTIFEPNTDIDALYRMPYIEVQQMITPILEGIKEPMVYETIPYDDFENMSLGDWINIEIYMREDDFENIFKIIYRDKIKYDECSPVDILGAYEDLIKYRKAVYENYSEVFKVGEEEADPDETPEEREERLEIEKENKNNSEWSWYLYVYDLAKGDILKFDEIFEKNHLFIFNMLHMKKRFKLNEVYRGLF